ncbi:MAG: YibE/F family protein [Peptococcaceae bacterium]|nr:YibE/F family protein [Peptococcaceae bacterium]MBQ5863402.1 YibE/F family protein [Peptococcaceae bacterium]
MNLNIRKKQMITYVAVLLVSILYIIVGHNLAIANYHAFSGDDQSIVIKAEVVELTDRYTVMYPLNEFEYAEDETIVFRAKVTSGDMKGQTIEAAQTLDYFTAVHLPVVEPGDRILLYSIPGGMAEHEWLMSDYQRFDQILILGAVFVLLVLLIGHWQGVNTLISLALTCLAVFYVFIPAVLAGESIYLWSIATCIYVTFMTLFIVNGVNAKSIGAILGCLAGIVVAAVLTLFFEESMTLTGLLDENSVLLYGLNPDAPFNLKAIIFAAIIIGSMGAIMDVSISIAAALEELKEKLPQITFRELFQSGMNISRDIMGTMANTLILAYIGSALAGVLLMVAYNSAMIDLFNREMIVVECLQALAGSIGILMALPFTALICALLYQSKK